ncbi:hypothetical protein ACHAO8_005624 [Botrytis cinerea]
MSTLTPPEDQPIKARSKSITPSQPQNATQLPSKTFGNILQVSSPPKSKSMIDLSTLRPETIAENKAKNKITKRKVRFADSGYFDGSRDAEENMFDCEVDL